MICAECSGTGEIGKCECKCGQDADIIISTFTPAFSILVVCQHCAEPYREKGWKIVTILNEGGEKK